MDHAPLNAPSMAPTSQAPAVPVSVVSETGHARTGIVLMIVLEAIVLLPILIGLIIITISRPELPNAQGLDQVDMSRSIADIRKETAELNQAAAEMQKEWRAWQDRKLAYLQLVQLPANTGESIPGDCLDVISGGRNVDEWRRDALLARKYSRDDYSRLVPYLKQFMPHDEYLGHAKQVVLELAEDIASGAASTEITYGQLPSFSQEEWSELFTTEQIAAFPDGIQRQFASAVPEGTARLAALPPEKISSTVVFFMTEQDDETRFKLLPIAFQRDKRSAELAYFWLTPKEPSDERRELVLKSVLESDHLTDFASNTVQIVTRWADKAQVAAVEKLIDTPLVPIFSRDILDCLVRLESERLDEIIVKHINDPAWSESLAALISTNPTAARAVSQALKSAAADPVHIPLIARYPAAGAESDSSWLIQYRDQALAPGINYGQVMVEIENALKRYKQQAQ